MKENRLSILLLLIIVSSMMAIAVPIGPEGVTNSSERFESTSWAPKELQAVAGNITELVITTWTLTRTWAGFYGNITGTIVLADTNNNTMYDWYDADPNGRVYASRDGAVDWATIACANKTAIMDGTEAIYTGTNETDRNGKYPVDAPNRTFVPAGGIAGVLAQPATFLDYPEIYVGPVNIDPSTCLSTSLHNTTGYVAGGSQNSGNDATHFRELALADSTGEGDIVYTTIIEQSWLGFDGRPHDFQMIVGEDGHGTNIASSSYFFYVELE